MITLVGKWLSSEMSNFGEHHPLVLHCKQCCIHSPFPAYKSCASKLSDWIQFLLRGLGVFLQLVVSANRICCKSEPLGYFAPHKSLLEALFHSLFSLFALKVDVFLFRIPFVILLTNLLLLRRIKLRERICLPWLWILAFLRPIWWFRLLYFQEIWGRPPAKGFSQFSSIWFFCLSLLCWWLALGRRSEKSFFASIFGISGFYLIR